MEKLKIDLCYYNSAHQILFQSFPNADELNTLIKGGIEISKDEFLGYMMFTEQMDRDGFRTYAELQQRIQNRLGDIDDFLSFNNSSVQARVSSSEMMQPGFTERIGVALGLCVLNKIYTLTAADWKKIPETRGRYAHPTFDFEIPKASTGAEFIRAENKGSIVVNNLEQPATVQNHYNRICTKKNYVRSEETIAGLTVHQNLYYGTIGVLNNRADSKARVWLVNPPLTNLAMEPSK